MWPQIHAAEKRIEALVEKNPEATGEQERLLNQLARELLLLESSDWPFLVTTGQAKEYASKRFVEHVERFNQLADLIEANQSLNAEQVKFLEKLSERDNPFPAVDYKNFSSRQGNFAKRESSGS
jgi:1,4-alpha-glucan branching enzyme